MDAGTRTDAGVAFEDGGGVFDAGEPPAFVDGGVIADAEADLIDKSLMILDPTVVDSSEAASRLDLPSGTGLGAWSFGHLAANIAGAQDPADFVEHFMNQLATKQTVNGFVSEPTINVTINANDAKDALDRWCRTAEGKLDLSRAPFRLMAIVNRPDLRQSSGDLGEMRFVFSLLETDDACRTDGNAMPVVKGGSGIAVIFEFAHPAGSCVEQLARARSWRHLAELPFGPGYHSALRELTEFVVTRRDPTRANSSQLNQLRVNTGASPSQWTLRELRLGGRTPNVSTGLNRLLLVPPAAVPDFATFNNSPELAQYLGAHSVELAAGTLMLQPVPDTFGGKNFGGATSSLLDQWQVGGAPQPAFTFMTCGGCHFHQAVGPHVGTGSGSLVGRNVGQPAGLSLFLRSFDNTSGDLFHRAALFDQLSTSGRCATADAFGVVSSSAPQTLSPTDTVWVNTIADVVGGAKVVLRLYAQTDADSAAPASSVTVAATSNAVTSSLVAPVTPGAYEVRLFVNGTRYAVARALHVELNHVYGVSPNGTPTAGAPLSVSWSAPNGHDSNDVIGVFRPGDPDDAPLATTLMGTGDASFDGLSVLGLASVTMPTTTGGYELRVLRAKTGVRVALSSITVH